MKYTLYPLIAFLLFFTYANSQSFNCPPNIDFELGDFSNWQCYTGTTAVRSGMNQITLTPSLPQPGRHEIISSTTDMDEYGNFPKLCPYGDRYSIKVGNSDIGAEAEGMSYTFQIPALDDTFSLTYYYAVVFEDPDHLPQEQPRFFVSAYDAATGAVINCAVYDYVSTASIPGFQRSKVDTGVLFKDWTPASLNFYNLGGRTIKIEFKTADCTLGGHFGYAYFDVGTGCGGVIANAAYCTQTNNVILNAPYGFQSYTWWNSTYTTIVGNSREVTLSPPPAASSTFWVDMIPYPGYGCRDTAFAKVTVLPVPDTPVIAPLVEYCQFEPSVSLSANGTLGNTILWYTTPTGGIGSDISPIPPTNNSGIFNYYVTQKKLFGCESFRIKATVIVSPTPINSFTVNSLRQCQDVNNFIFTNATTNTTANRQYLWEFGDGLTDTARNTTHKFINGGIYTVKLKVLNPPKCFSEKTATVTVVPKPVATFLYPPLICGNQTLVTLLDNSIVPSGLGTVNNWWWKIGDNNIQTIKNPTNFYVPPGPLKIKFVVKSTEGCKSDTNNTTLNIHYLPITKFTFNKALCNNEVVQFADLSSMPLGAAPDYVAKWNWALGATSNSTLQNPSKLFNQGTFSISLFTESNVGCKNSVGMDTSIVIYSKPIIKLNISDSCVFRNILYNAISLPGPSVNKWYWDFGNGLAQGTSFYRQNYTMGQSFNLKLIGETIEGCKDTIIRPFKIYYNRANAGRDTITAKDEPVLIPTTGEPGTRYVWTPSIGLNSTTIKNPIATWDADQLYELNTISKEGCDARSKILIRRYKGPELYVPSAFSPNNDGKNEVLHVFPVGIKSFGYFSIYNRAGVLIFKTNNAIEGWNGRFNGTPCDPGNYVFYSTAIDYKGGILTKKGNVILIR
jgi:gliding motility-associated-like protein